ncbi:MAG: response regulator [Phycisphaerae bacterium]
MTGLDNYQGSGGQESDKPSPRVLLMDDEEAILRVTGKLLGYLGYDVELAREGAEAVEAYHQAREAGRPFDLVILDLTVHGGMGGQEALQRLRQIDPGVRAIVSSGYRTDPVVSDYESHGFSGAASKPYQLDDLRRAIDEAMA